MRVATRVVGVAKAQADFAPLGQKGQLHVFQNLVRHPGVAAEAAIGLALDQQKLAVGGGDALRRGRRLWPADRPAPARKKPAASASAAPAH